MRGFEPALAIISLLVAVTPMKASAGMVSRPASGSDLALGFAATTLNPAPHPINAEQARTQAGEVAEPPASSLSRTLSHLSGVAGTFITLGLLGIGLVIFGRSHLEVVSDTASHSFLRSLSVGLVAQVLIIPTFGVLVVGLVLSVVGVLLVPFVVVVYALLVIAAVLGGFLAVAHAMGETHTRRRMARGAAVSPNSFRYLAIGLGSIATIWMAWVVFGWVPVAGGFILAAAAISTWLLASVGLGAAVLSRVGIQPSFSGRYLPAEMLTDEYLWATPQQGVPAVKRPDLRR